MFGARFWPFAVSFLLSKYKKMICYWCMEIWFGSNVHLCDETNRIKNWKNTATVSIRSWGWKKQERIMKKSWVRGSIMWHRGDFCLGVRLYCVWKPLSLWDLLYFLKSHERWLLWKYFLNRKNEPLKGSFLKWKKRWRYENVPFICHLLNPIASFKLPCRNRINHN